MDNNNFRWLTKRQDSLFFTATAEKPKQTEIPDATADHSSTSIPADSSCSISSCSTAPMSNYIPSSTAKMSERALDYHPSDKLDVGVCRSGSSVLASNGDTTTEQHGANNKDSNSAVTDSSESIFMLFEKRLMEMRKADADLSSDDEGGRETLWTKLRRTQTNWGLRGRSISQSILRVARPSIGGSVSTEPGKPVPLKSTASVKTRISLRRQVLLQRPSSMHDLRRKKKGTIGDAGKLRGVSSRDIDEQGNVKTAAKSSTPPASPEKSGGSLKRRSATISRGSRSSLSKSATSAGAAGEDSGVEGKPKSKLTAAEELSILEQHGRLEIPLVERMGANCRRVVIAADTTMLLTLLINPNVDNIYTNFTRDFLLTYRHYMTERQFWSGIRARFDEWSTKVVDTDALEDIDAPINPEECLGRSWVLNKSDAMPILLRIVNVIQMWLQSYCYLDFDAADTPEGVANLDLLNTILEFINNVVGVHQRKHIRTCAGPLLQFLKTKFVGLGVQFPTATEVSELPLPDINAESNNSNCVVELYNATPPATPLPSDEDVANEADEPAVIAPTVSSNPLVRNRPRKGTNPHRTHASFLSLNPEELFRQLTLIELGQFLSIRPLDLYYKSIGRLDRAPHLAALIKRFNFVSYWVATEICMSRDTKARSEVLKLFIKVAKMCFKWHNYSTCLQIIAALSMTCVRRLKRTWKLLPKKYENAYRHLSETFSASCNYANYRHDILARLEETATSDSLPSELVIGGIPFMGVHLSDLVLIEEAHGRDVFPNGMVNFTKMRMIAESFKQFVQLQRITSYPFQLDAFTQRFLIHDVFALEEDKLWKASRICEPADCGDLDFQEPKPSLLSRIEEQDIDDTQMQQIVSPTGDDDDNGLPLTPDLPTDFPPSPDKERFAEDAENDANDSPTAWIVEDYLECEDDGLRSIGIQTDPVVPELSPFTRLSSPTRKSRAFSFPLM